MSNTLTNSDTELQQVINDAMTTPEGEQRKPTTREIAEYRKTLKENTELLELEARNWKAQYDSLMYRIEIGKINSALQAQQVPMDPDSKPQTDALN